MKLRCPFWKVFRYCLVSSGLTFGFLMLAAGAASAQTITVDDGGDVAVAGDTKCTLREAINNANANGDTTSGDCEPGVVNDTIVFTVAGVTVTSRLPNIATNLVISGSGVRTTISGGGTAPIFEKNSEFVLYLEWLDLVDGNAGGDDGGALAADEGSIYIDRCTFERNSALRGGAISVVAGVQVEITRSTFNQNGGMDTTYGGAIFQDGYGPNLPVYITNSTLVGNTAPLGAAIYHSGYMRIVNSTLADNTTGGGNGAIYTAGYTLTLKNTLLVGGEPANCAFSVGTIDADLSNIADDSSCDDARQRSTAAINLDPAGLADNGGFTETIALKVPSAAVDAGDDTICNTAEGTPGYGAGSLDQRTVQRSHGPHCDVGAYELVSCTQLPRDLCTEAESESGSLGIKHNGDKPSKSGITWKWGKGDAVLPDQIGDPSDDATYFLCVYDGNSSLKMVSAIPPGGTCDGKPCWKQTGKGATIGYKYKSTGETSSGIIGMNVKAGPDGKAKAQVKGKGMLIDASFLPLGQSPGPAMVQLYNSVTEACLESRYHSPPSTDPASTTKFQDKNN